MHTFETLGVAFNYTPDGSGSVRIRSEDGSTVRIPCRALILFAEEFTQNALVSRLEALLDERSDKITEFEVAENVTTFGGRPSDGLKVVLPAGTRLKLRKSEL